jgi:hypothetical protein
MKVAEILVTHASRMSMASIACIGFETASGAAAEFERLKTYLDKREARANDIDKIITVVGINSFSCPGDEIAGISLVDFARSNESEAGVRDAFPNLFKR